MSEAPALSLAVGDRVVYPNQGICRVTSVEAREVAGQTLTFVTMRREEDGAVVMVPQGKIRSIGLRKVSSSKDVEQIFEFLRSDTDKTTLDWKQRARSNLDRMSTGGLLGLAEVVKGLQVLSELRPLPTKERELYDNARHLLISEISASIGITPCDAEDAIDIILFVPGKERPKRTAEEFRQRGDDLGEGDELGELSEDLIGLGGELDLGAAVEEAPPEEAEGEEGAEEAPEEVAGTRKSASKKSAPAAADAPKKKRGRPPKPKPEGPPPPPKKRGRPPKAKPVVSGPPPPPKKRGRPPKAKTAAAAPKSKKK